MTFKDSIKGASPVNLHDIGKKTHVTVELGLLIRGMVIIAMVVAGYLNFIARINGLESANRGLRDQLVIADSLLRKDIRITLNTLHKDITTKTAGLVTALDTDIREVKISLATESAAMVAATKANSERIAIELNNLKSLLVSVNRTTHAELKPAINSVQNALDIQAEALNQRISLIEGQLQDQVKRSLFGRFVKM